MIKSFNSKLLAIEEKAKSAVNNNIVFSLDNLDRLFNIQMQDIFDCILIIDDEEIELTQEQFVEVIKMYGDKTGYEVSNNELRVIDYSDTILTEEEQYLLGKSLILDLSHKIRPKMVYYFSFDNDALTIRFHKFREEEGLWINEEIEEYNEPLGYFITN